MPIPFGLAQVHQAQGLSWGDAGSNELDAVYFNNSQFVVDTRGGGAAIGSGDKLLTYAPLSLEIANGTSGNPLTTAGPSIRISRTENPSSAYGGNAVDNSSNAGIVVTSVGQSGSAMQVAGASLLAQGNASHDSVAVLGTGWAVTGTGRGTGGYLEGRRDVAGAKALSAEFRSNNNTASAGVFSGSSLSDTAGLWLTAGGTSDSAEAIGIGAVGATRWLYGISSKNGGGPKNATLRDDSSAQYCIQDAGSHANAAVAIASTSPVGIDFVGGTFSGGPIRIPNNSQFLAQNFAANANLGLFYLNTSNQFVLVQPTVATGSFQTQGNLGFYSISPVAQQSGTGNTHTVAAGSTTNVFINTTFDGSTGSTAYTVGDIVKALKNYGLLAS